MTEKDTTVLMGGSKRSRPASDPGSAWRFLGWFGAAIAFIGFTHVGLNFFPAMAFGSPEWEFGTMALVLSGLPLGTMGLAGLVAATVATGSRKGMIASTVLLVGLLLVVSMALIVFLTVVPLAVQGTPPGSAIGLKQTVAKTLVMGGGFALLYGVAAVGLLRHLLRTRRRTNA